MLIPNKLAACSLSSWSCFCYMMKPIKQLKFLLTSFILFLWIASNRTFPHPNSVNLEHVTDSRRCPWASSCRLLSVCQRDAAAEPQPGRPRTWRIPVGYTFPDHPWIEGCQGQSVFDLLLWTQSWPGEWPDTRAQAGHLTWAICLSSPSLLFNKTAVQHPASWDRAPLIWLLYSVSTASPLNGSRLDLIPNDCCQSWLGHCKTNDISVLLE